MYIVIYTYVGTYIHAYIPPYIHIVHTHTKGHTFT